MKGKMGNGLKHDDPSNSFSANAPQCTMVPLLHSPSLVHFPPLSFEHPPPTLLYPSPSALPFPSALLYPFAPPPILLYPNPSSLTSLFPHCSTLPLVHSSFPSIATSPFSCAPSPTLLYSTPSALLFPQCISLPSCTPLSLVQPLLQGSSQYTSLLQCITSSFPQSSPLYTLIYDTFKYETNIQI